MGVELVSIRAPNVLGFHFIELRNNNRMKRKTVLTGILGLIGAVLMYTGDMLLYFTTKPIASFEEEIVQIMAQVSQERLMAGGLLGPISAFLYMIGFYHIYLRIKPGNKIARVFIGLLCFGIVYGGAFHSHFTFIGLASSFNQEEMLHLFEKYSVLNFNLMFLPSLLAYCFLAYLILAKKTFYPRWVVLCSPIVLFWFSGVLKYLPQPLMVLTAGGWSNMIFVVFFSISTVLSFKAEYVEIKETPTAPGASL